MRIRGEMSSKRFNMNKKILVIVFASLIGCASPQPDRYGYIIHDTVNDDYYAGQSWVEEEKAWVMTKRDAEGALKHLIKNESGGYANPATAIKIVRVPYRSQEHLDAIIDNIQRLRK